jgi:DNA mismatch repair protein MutL
LLGDQLDFFNAIGFEIEPFGRHLFRIRSIPSWIQAEKAETFVEELVYKIRERGLRPEERKPATTLVARMAAIREARGYTPDGDTAWKELATALLQCENPLLDARGRPAFVEMRHAEINRKLMLERYGAESDGLEGSR